MHEEWPMLEAILLPSQNSNLVVWPGLWLGVLLVNRAGAA